MIRIIRPRWERVCDWIVIALFVVAITARVVGGNLNSDDGLIIFMSVAFIVISGARIGHDLGNIEVIETIFGVDTRKNGATLKLSRTSSWNIEY